MLSGVTGGKVRKMRVRHYVVMVRDELGYEHRAEGSEKLSAVYEFPYFTEANIAMWNAFNVWSYELEQELQAEWDEIYGPESRVYLEQEAWECMREIFSY